MADIAIALEAADILSLGSNWVGQSTTLATNQQTAEMVKADGDLEKYATPFDAIDAGTVSYKWSSATGLGTAMSSLLGAVQNAYMITEMQIETVWNDFPTINFTFHNHGANAHTTGNAYAVPADMIAILTGAFGAYDFFGKASATTSIVNASYAILLDHIDENGATGDHWVGTNIRGREEATCTYLGNAATPTTVSGWTITAADTTDSNQDHDKSSITGQRIVLRT